MSLRMCDVVDRPRWQVAIAIHALHSYPINGTYGMYSHRFRHAVSFRSRVPSVAERAFREGKA